MTRFRPCIDLHAGSVKQIVGGTLTASNPSSLTTNHVSSLPAEHFAQLYKTLNLQGAHIIKLGPGNDLACEAALEAWPGHLQVGGGITAENAGGWIAKGAGKIIVTSFLFPKGKFGLERLEAVLEALGREKDKLVVDLSCRRRKERGESQDGRWVVAMDQWQRDTDMEVCKESIKMLEPYCSEFLIHAADNEGLQKGIDEELVERLADWCSIPVTYAGGARTIEDLETVKVLSKGKVDLTIGSALDVFGGSGVRLDECVTWNQQQEEMPEKGPR